MAVQLGILWVNFMYGMKLYLNIATSLNAPELLHGYPITLSNL